MTDLKTRFEGADRITAPNLWADIKSREPGRVPSEPRASRKIAVAAFAGVIAAVAIWFAIRAIGGGSSQPASTGGRNGLIAFAVTTIPSQPGQPIVQGIDVVNPGGSGLHALTPDDALYLSPAWSPDGTSLAYVRFERKGDAFDEGIFVANADGTGARKVYGSGQPIPISLSRLAWSPDGTKIGFVETDRPADGQSHSEADDVMRLMVMNADGTNVTALAGSTANDWGQITSFSWSPDGTQMIFTRQGIDGVRFVDDLFVMNADGSQVTRLTSDGRSLDPSWSPDGLMIAFESYAASQEYQDRGIYLMRATGVGRIRLTSDSGTADNPVWSPDGTEIAFTKYESGQNCSLVVIAADGGVERTLITRADVSGCPATPSWQPVPIEANPPSTLSPTPSPETTALSDVALPDGLSASRLSVGDDAIWALASTGQAGSMVLVHINPVSNQVVATTRLEGKPWYMAAGSGAVWVGSPSASTVRRIDAVTNEVTADIKLPGDGVSAIAGDDQALWVEVILDRSDEGKQNLASLVRIDPGTDEIAATIPLDGLSGYDDEIAIGADAVWVAGANLTGPSEERGADLVRIDPTTNSIAAVVPVSAFSVRAEADAVWVTAPADGVNDSVHTPEAWVAQEIDPATNGVSEPIPLPGNVSDVLAVTADGVWFSGYDAQGRIHPVAWRDEAFDVTLPPVDSVYTDMVFDDGSGTIWIAATNGLKRIDLA